MMTLTTVTLKQFVAALLGLAARTSAQSVRLHPHPLDWLEAGCTGACHIALISRKALKELRAAKTIQCNDIGTALEAWDWGFSADDEELGRFVIDADEANILEYIKVSAWARSRPIGRMSRLFDAHVAERSMREQS
jgi:hypothetical protein